jgi:hypothetical protein
MAGTDAGELGCVRDTTSRRADRCASLVVQEASQRGRAQIT